MTLAAVITAEFNVDDLSDDWESLVGAGQTIIQAHDRNRWALGDIAIKASKRYGEQDLGKLARAINVRPSTLYDYHRTSKFYAPDLRNTFQTLSWSHYRAAIAAKDLESAMDLLARAEDNHMNVDDFGKLVRGKGNSTLLLSVIVQSVRHYSRRNGEITLVIDDKCLNDADAFMEYYREQSNKQPVRLALREVKVS